METADGTEKGPDNTAENSSVFCLI